MAQTFSYEDALPKAKTFSYEDALGTDAGASALEKVAVAAQPAVEPALKVLKAVAQGYPVVEAGANVLSSVPAAIASGLTGIVTGNDQKAMDAVTNAMTYQPRSEGGKLLAGGIQYPVVKLAEAADVAGEKVLEITGSPVAATAVNTAIQAAPMLLGIRAKPGTKFGFDEASRVEPTLKAEPASEGAAAESVAARVEPTLAEPIKPTAVDATFPSTVDPALNARVAASHNAILAEQASKQGELALDQPQAPAPDTTVNLNLGVSPVEAIKAIKESYSPFVGVPVELRKRGQLADSLTKVFAPAARSEEATRTANIVRANLGRQALEREQALTQLKDTAALFDRMPPEENYKFINAMESGAKLDDPTLNKAASDLRNLLDTKREEVRALGTGRLEDFIDNYFPHIWADQAKAASFFSRRPLEGSKAFLKQRTFDTFKEGMDAGLVPLTNNPVELALLKAREMDRYVTGQRIFGEMKDAGLAKFVKFGDRSPDGFAKINDKIARVMNFSEPEGGMILRGEYYAPEPAAHIINNHVSPGLQGNGVFDAIRQSGNMMNSLQLGLSAFHLGFTTLDAMISKIALGVKQASRGDILPGIANIAQGFNPVQPLMNLMKGDKLLKAYTGELKDPGLAPIVEALTDAGGRIRMDDFYRNTTINGFKQALRTGRYGDAGLKLLPTLMDRINKPMFEYLVPRQKLGVFFDMAKDALEKNPGMDLATKRQVMGKLWDSVDNRMGELVYDNLFWNRALKDGLMASVRSVGWNLGTFRELGGGVADVRKIVANKGLTDRTSYIVALPFMTSVIGSVLNYLYTGESPRDLKDSFFPRTGKIRPDGSEDRLSLPSYMKDVYEYGHDIMGFGKYGSDPTRTLQNKMHPLLSTVTQMISNKDFFGANIRNPTSPLVEQLLDEGKYIFKQIEPFSLRNYLQQSQVKKETPTLTGYLTSPSMIGITPAPGYVTKNEAQAESAAINANRDAMIKRFRQDLKDGESRDKIVAQMQKAGFGPRDIMFVLRGAQEDRPPPKLKKYGE